MQVIELSARFKFIFLLFIAVPLSAQKYPDENVHNLLMSGIEDIINFDFDNAEIVFNKLNTEYKELPLGKIYLNSLHIMRSATYMEPYEEKLIDSLFDSSLEQCDSLLEADENNIWYNYFAGLASGNKAMYAGHRGNFISALFTGLSSISYFERCLELDPAFTESYFAIGSFLFWRSEITQVISWLPFIDNDSEKGLQLIEKAIHRAVYNKYLAVYGLLEIYLNEEEYEKAEKLAKLYVDKYPNSAYFRFQYANAKSNINKEEAINEFYVLLDLIKKLDYPNNYNELYFKFRIAKLYYEIGNFKISLQLCEEILNTPEISDYVKYKLESRLEYLREIKEDMVEKTDN